MLLNSRLLVWDNADSSPDWEKVASTLVKISDADGFKWEDFQIERTNPEKWQYVGEQ